MPSDWLIAGPASTAAGRPLFTRTSFIHRQGAPFPIFAIQAQDSRLGAFLGVHGREGEPAGASGHFIHDHVDLVYRAVLAKHVPEVVFGDVKGKIPDI